MKLSRSFQWPSSATRLLGAAVCLVPSLLLAHPGHYHPDETDEFDFFRATFLHSHGAMDYLLVAIAVVSLVLAIMNGRPAVRVSAAVAALGSLALIPIL